MSKKNLLGMEMVEWKSLAGLHDPYSLELAKISAEAGVPKAYQLAEAAMPAWKKEKRLSDIKRSHRALRRGGSFGGEDPLANKDKMKKMGAQLAKLMRQKSEDGEQYVFPYDSYLDAFLEDNGSSLYEFNFLMDHAIESGDAELADELLAVEAQLDEILGGVAGLAGAARAVGQGAMKVGGAVAKGAGKVGGAVAKGAGKVGDAVAKGAGKLAGQAQAGFQSGMKAAGDAAAAAPAAQAPAPSAQAPAPTGAPEAPKAQTAGGDAAGASPTQPGQSMVAKKPAKGKNPGVLGTLARGIGKVAKGVVSLPGGVAATAGRAVGQVAGGFKKGYGEDIDIWEEILAENDMTVDQYLSVVEHAYAIGDIEMIEELQRLDEIFGLRKKREAAEQERQAKVKAGWDAAKKVRSQYGVQATRDASNRGQDVRRVATAKPKTVGEAIAKQLSLAGYSDEYIEARSKEQQYKGQQAMADSDKVPFRVFGKGKDSQGRQLSPSERDVSKNRVRMKLGVNSMLGDKLKNRALAKERGQ